jgi:uncharacterized membrane protein (UPF0127 family)
MALLLFFASAVAAADQVVRLPSEPLVIETASGNELSFDAEIADDDAERSRGLMFRRSMQEREAMLFIWPEPYEVGMWMRNTYIPLDMLFITADGEVVHIARETVPHSLDVVSAGREVLAVLEIKGGAAGRLGIAPGDRVRHRFFARQ